MADSLASSPGAQRVVAAAPSVLEGRVTQVDDAGVWVGLSFQQGQPPRRCPTPVMARVVRGDRVWVAESDTGETVIVAADASLSAVVAAGPLSVREEGAKGDGLTDDTVAVQAAMIRAAALRRPLYFDAGIYSCRKLYVPEELDLMGAGRRCTRLRYRDTNGGVFIWHYGSHCTVEGLTIDGMRVNQPQNAGLAAIQFAKPNGTAVGGLISGGLMMTADAVTGATSITVATATLVGNAGIQVTVRPNEVLSLVQGTIYEQVRVAADYVAGATTITLAQPLRHDFPATSSVSVYLTESTITNCRVLGCGRDGISFYKAFGCLAQANYVYDCSDTCIDLPAGSSMCRVLGNHAETNGRWGVYVDGADAARLGPARLNVIDGNTIRFLNGGVDALGTLDDGIGMGTGVHHIVVSANVIDISAGGRAGIMLQLSGTPVGRISVVGNTVIGGRLANQTGIRVELGSDAVNHAYPAITGNTVSDVDIGINLGWTLRCAVSGNVVQNVIRYGINFDLHPTVAQDVVAMANHVEDCVAGIRFGGVTGAASVYRQSGNVVAGASFGKVAADAGWTPATLP